MTKLWSVKEFCDITNLSIRTLHYYDKQNILSPTYKKGNGTRYYSYESLLTVQKITTLKYVGFDLKQIKQILSTSEFDLLKSLQLQEYALRDNIAQINKGIAIVEKGIEQYTKSGNIEWDTMGKMLNAFKISHHELTKEWAERNFSTQERGIFGDKEFQITKIDYMQPWIDLFTQSTIALRQNKDPYSPEVQILAQKWIDLWTEMSEKQYPNNPELANKMWELMKAGDIPDGLIKGYDHEMILYMNKAMEYIENASKK
ncbi:MAG: MerR family transcriptional regulator [Pseudomonadota bacterium]|jgi:DNA-binding transcriptional MerR regulator|nr:MerR family transcriptional regulator [Burkholderiales bacterium]MDQ5921469.1 MerR family transcriptional regulator [Pseudomonadota bacterium]